MSPHPEAIGPWDVNQDIIIYLDQESLIMHGNLQRPLGPGEVRTQRPLGPGFQYQKQYVQRPLGPGLSTLISSSQKHLNLMKSTPRGHWALGCGLEYQQTLGSSKGRYQRYSTIATSFPNHALKISIGHWALEKCEPRGNWALGCYINKSSTC